MQTLKNGFLISFKNKMDHAKNICFKYICEMSECDCTNEKTYSFTVYCE